MRILVTGGAGFIGSAFVRNLIAGKYSAIPGGALRNSDVIILDKLTYAGNRANIAPVADRIQFVEGDIADRRLVDDLMSGTDLVVHFAAESHVDRSITGPANFVATNVAGTQTLLDSALHGGVARFVHISTDEVYGTIDSGSWSENRPLQPNSPYSATKAAADLLVRAYHRTHQLDVVITRASNNYGPYQFPEKMIPLFITNLIRGLPVPLYGDGLHVRDWLHVDDHCAGIALVAAGGRSGEVYNIGGGTELTNRTLTKLLLDALGASWERVELVEDRQGHDRRYSLSIDKIRAELGYEPGVPFTEGLAQTVAWYRDNRSWWEPQARHALVG